MKFILCSIVYVAMCGYLVSNVFLFCNLAHAILLLKRDQCALTPICPQATTPPNFSVFVLFSIPLFTLLGKSLMQPFSFI